MHRFLLAASLILATPLFPSDAPQSFVDPHVDKGELRWFHLTESKQEVRQLLGAPKLQADFGTQYSGWQYQIGEIGDEDYSHYLVFSKADGGLVSVARNYDPERTVDELFPSAATVTYTLKTPDDSAGNRMPPFRVRVRRLSGSMMLLGMGVAKAGEPCGQIVLIRESALRVFYPALAAEIGL